MKRRLFLKAAAAGSILPVSLNGMSLRTFAHSSLLGAIGKRANDTNRVLVIIQLSGGNDGLNMVLPIDQYSNLSKARSNILISESKILKLNGTDKTGLHPQMTGLQSMYNNGLVSAVQAVGYPQPNFSHFRASDIWMSGSDSDKVVTSGWMGRYLDQRFTNFPTNYPNSTMPDPLAIQIGSMVSLNFMGPSVSMGMAISDPSTFYNLQDGTSGNVPSRPYGDELSFIRVLAQQTNQYATVVKAAANVGKNLSTKYISGNGLCDQLKVVAKLISGGLKTPVYMVSMGGFDTHSNQVDSADSSNGTHANLMKQLSDAIYAFQDDIKLLGVSDRVAGMTFSEFGRRIQSNASGGTDHGAAAPLFVFGEGVQPGIIGNNPSIPNATTVNDNVPMQNDFRQIYASILMDWFGLKATEVKSVLNNADFTILPIFKSNAASVEDFRILNSQMAIKSVFPNPAKDNATITLDSDVFQMVNVSIFDSLGSNIDNFTKKLDVGENNISVDFNGYKPGNYFIKILGNGYKPVVSSILIL